ncbi:MAG: 4Fe-4S dicluster domain-containing protein [Thaumarchaeota archaeon]|nr:4Fe-4S dicluster domain-containing protein [Candidatus Calditenuaceae archaeon]MDW8042001.1 4Fe-4S dicluster domain-containing protein [Nitrososphaerota archaeon]
MRPSMVIDLNKCVGCRACVAACLLENATALNGAPFLDREAVKYSRTLPVMTRTEEVLRRVFKQCVQCDSPPCVSVCPTGATFRTSEGVVLVNRELCIGCGLCRDACPYDVIRFPDVGVQRAWHRYAVRQGVPDRCTLCYHRKTEDGKLWTPACVEACAFDARIFGDLDDPSDRVTRLVRTGVAIGPRPDFQTNPKLFFVPRRGGYELVNYPTRSEYSFGVAGRDWSFFKDHLFRPLAEIAMSAAVVFGLIHIVREVRKTRRKGEEG